MATPYVYQPMLAPTVASMLMVSALTQSAATSTPATFEGFHGTAVDLSGISAASLQTGVTAAPVEFRGGLSDLVLLHEFASAMLIDMVDPPADLQKLIEGHFWDLV